MKNLLLAGILALICHQSAAAYWPTTEVTREKAEEEKLPLFVNVTDLGDGTVQVEYEIILTGPFTHLRDASVYAAKGGKLLLQVAIPVTGTPRPIPEGGVSDGLMSVRGKCRVGKDLLSKCRLQLDCPIEPLNLSGQTFSVDLSSYHR